MFFTEETFEVKKKRTKGQINFLSPTNLKKGQIF